VGVQTPLHVARVGATFVGVRSSFKYHVWMFLLKNSPAVQSHLVRESAGDLPPKSRSLCSTNRNEGPSRFTVSQMASGFRKAVYSITPE
jgi:hypothetical protein